MLFTRRVFCSSRHTVCVNAAGQALERFPSFSRTSISVRNQSRYTSTAAVEPVPVAPGDLPEELQAHQVSFDFDNIPVIDLGKAEQGAAARSSLLSELRRATEEIGFMTVINHGVPFETKEAMLTKSREFFNLPQEMKDPFKQDRETVAGYVQNGMEHLGNIHKGDTSGRTDCKETFDMSMFEYAPENEHADAWRWQSKESFPERDVPGFTHAMETYQAAALTLGMHLVDLIGEALFCSNSTAHNGKSKILWNACHRKTVCHHRLLHYPPLRNYTSEISTGAHIDYGLLTILATDAVSGLQVLNSKKNLWIHVFPCADGLVINFGHMLSAWTGGRAKAAVHRVVNVHAGKPRFSSPFFFRPALNTVLNPRDFDPEAEISTTTCREVLKMFYERSSLLTKT